MAKCSGVTGFVKTCGDCIHADICEHNPTIEFNRENIAWCGSFKDKTDVVEVVRCKDCEYGEQYDVAIDGWFECHYDGWGIGNDGDHFCSHGKRKEGEQA